MSTLNPSLNPAELDAISLARALRDFEIANARVLDLTQRLLESERQRKNLADQLERVRILGVPMGSASAPGPSLRARVVRRVGRAAKQLLRVNEP